MSQNSLDLEKIRTIAEREESNEQYGIASGHALRASRVITGRLLAQFGKMSGPDRKFGVFTTGILLRSDFTDSYLGSGVWLMDGLEISTVINEGDTFKRSMLDDPEENFSLHVDAFQIASPAADLPATDGWRSKEERVGKHQFSYLARPQQDTFSVATYDDHHWLLASYREKYAQANHLIHYRRVEHPASRYDPPAELVDVLETTAIQENYETLARMVGEITMPLSAVAKHAELRAAWSYR